MRTINVGLIGAGFMGKAHSLAYAAMPMFFWPAPAVPHRKIICDVTEEAAAEGAQRYGFDESTADWKRVVEHPDVEVVDIATPNHMHAEIARAAAAAGKHIICEKPLARTAEEARTMYEAVRDAGVVHMVAFNYRRTPAVALAKRYIDEGAIGELISFRGTYLQDWSADPESPLSAGGADQLGTGRSAGDAPRGPVDVDDEMITMLRFSNGAIGSLEATRNGHGRNNFLTFELHGTEGSIVFNYERRDELQVCFASDGADRKGFRTVYTGAPHPYGEALWPIPALGIGYGETKIIECHDLFQAIVGQEAVSPDFGDGYQIARISDAILESSATESWVSVPPLETTPGRG
ncbi:Gfo/Idh/MocA family oxidoreductase [Saccharopolyspora hirsuta]|uniref:Gfo/Idh/MocA family protein n=1 Tax=Saccharopolyspora hirsuta TaxID=1837 RepID=UPI00332CCA8A